MLLLTFMKRWGPRKTDPLPPISDPAVRTAGMVLACSTSPDRDAQYMKAEDVTGTGVATPSAEATPVLIDLNFGPRS